MKRYLNGYSVRDDLHLFYRDDNGKLQRDIVPGEQVAFFHSNEVTSVMRRDKRILRHTTDQHGYTRFVFKSGYWDPDRPNKWSGKPGMWVPYREQVCKEWGVQSYEGDVSPLRRYLSESSAGIATPNRCYLDIETDSRGRIEDMVAGHARILCWTVCNHDRTKKYRGWLNDWSDEAERQLLNELWTVLAEYDQAVGWNIDGFDKPVIRERTRLLCPDNWDRRILWMDHMLAYKRHNIASAESGDEKQSFALDVVATNELGFGKHDFDASKTYEAWLAGDQRLIEYCMQDTELMPQLEDKTGYLALTQTICELCGIFPETKALNPTQQVDGFMLRLGHELGVHFKTKWYDDNQIAHQPFPGAFVMEPQSQGITKDVLCGDFSSMYPSIIITWNLSPDVKDPDGLCISPSNGCRTSEKRTGIMALALKRLLLTRKELKAAGNERGEKAVKIVANSFYGVLGNKYSRFYDIELCEATTQNGAWLIKLTIAEAEKRGWRAIYADTDSIFCIGPTEQEFREFLKWCNEDLYPRLTREQGCKDCCLSIAYDKGFEHIVFTAAKRYVAKQRGEDKPVIKGLEYKRGDINKIARDLQKTVIYMIAAGETSTPAYEKLISEYREKVAVASLDRDLVVITKSVNDLDSYDSNPPQLRIAEILKERGHDIKEGTRVSYVIIDGYSSPKKVIPAEDYTGGEVDRDALWNHSVYPATRRLLEAAFPQGPWARWQRKGKPKIKHDPRQLGLFS